MKKELAATWEVKIGQTDEESIDIVVSDVDYNPVTSGNNFEDFAKSLSPRARSLSNYENRS